MISYLLPGKRVGKKPPSLPLNNAPPWHFCPTSAAELQDCLFPWEQGLVGDSKSTGGALHPWPVLRACGTDNQVISQAGKSQAISIIYTWAQLNEPNTKLSLSVEQTVWNCWTKGRFRIWHHTTEAPHEQLCKAGAGNCVSARAFLLKDVYSQPNSNQTLSLLICV